MSRRMSPLLSLMTCKRSFLAIYQSIFINRPLHVCSYVIKREPGILVAQRFSCQLDKQFLQSMRTMYFVILIAHSQQLFQRAKRNDLAFIHNGDTIAEPLSLFHIMGCVE